MRRFQRIDGKNVLYVTSDDLLYDAETRLDLESLMN